MRRRRIALVAGAAALVLGAGTVVAVQATGEDYPLGTVNGSACASGQSQRTDIDYGIPDPTAADPTEAPDQVVDRYLDAQLPEAKSKLKEVKGKVEKLRAQVDVPNAGPGQPQTKVIETQSQDVNLVDGKGRPHVVLKLDKTPGLGWHITQTHECTEGGL